MITINPYENIDHFSFENKQEYYNHVLNGKKHVINGIYLVEQKMYKRVILLLMQSKREIDIEV